MEVFLLDAGPSLLAPQLRRLLLSLEALQQFLDAVPAVLYHIKPDDFLHGCPVSFDPNSQAQLLEQGEQQEANVQQQVLLGINYPNLL